MPDALQGLIDDEPQATLPAAPVPALPQIRQPAGITFRNFQDVSGLRTSIFDRTLAAAQKFQPIENKTHRLELVDVAYDGPERYSRAQQKDAVLTNSTLGRKLKGTWRLTDLATGAPIVDRRMTIAQVPYLGDRGAFIINGNRYSLGNQQRLRSGVYARRKGNGELESHINVLPGEGLAHKMLMDPETGRFGLRIAQGNIPLWPVLRAMGVSQSQLREAWGDTIAGENMRKDEPAVIGKLFKRLVKGVPGDPESQSAAVAEAFRKMRLDKDVTSKTLGEAFDHLDASVWLAASKKLLAINKGEAETDDRDHPAYQTVLGPEDLIAERFGRDKNTLRKMLWKAGLTKKLDHIQSGALTQGLYSAITDSGIGLTGEEINPAMLVEQMFRVSRMGDGGIPSLDSVPDESRAVQPSQFGFIDPIVTPESGKAGVDARFASVAVKGSDGRVYSPLRDIKTGELVYKSPQDIQDSVLAFPNSLRSNSPRVAAMVGGRMRYVPRDSVEFEVPDMESAFSPLVRLVPMKSAMKGQRVSMAQRMITQALPLMKAEAPFVRTGVPGAPDDSFESQYGGLFGASRADVDGVVESVEPDQITVRGADGKKQTIELYNNDPGNRKTFWHNTPLVQPGQRVTKNQLLARSNFTDDNGNVALGTNARVAYVAWKGRNFEDGYVVSESFAKQNLASEHMYQHGLEATDGLKTGKKDFVSIFPGKFDKRVLDSIDDDGVVKPGTVLQPDDPVILGAKMKERSANSLSRSRNNSFSDQTERWDHHAPGLVTDVRKTKKGTVVTIKSQMEAQVGDKISGRMGDKGVISRIIPDEQMPQDGQGRPFQVLASPLGIITRTNPNQMIEAALGKIAERTGKVYNVQDFDNIEDLTQFAMDELAKHGMSDVEDLIDPNAGGRKIPGIFTGNRFIMKLHHTAESKGQGRGTDGGYTAEGLPSKGGAAGSKRVSMLDVNALLSHGATNFLRDASVNRGQEHPDSWTMYMSGNTPPNSKVPLIYQKAVNLLRGSGINVVRNGTKFQLLAMTDDAIRDQAGDRELTSADTVDWKEGLKPIKGGLFDPTLTGGHGGNRWSYIKLQEPMPNPAMEEPIRKILGLTEQKFLDILGGKEKLNNRTGPEALRHALLTINIPQAIQQAREDVASGKKTARDGAVRRLRYLKNAEATGIHPKDWMVSMVPVLPPIFRPVSVMQGSKLPMVADANALYREVFEANDVMKHLKDQVDDVSEERLAIYNAYKGLVGLGEPTHPKNRDRQVKGLLRTIFGTAPKRGMVQQKLIGSVVDTVGRGVVVPDPDLDMDEIGLPESHAWSVYAPHVVRRLVRNGMSRQDAARALKEKNHTARKALVAEMDDRPAIMNRAPTLHRYNLMAFRPKLVSDDTIHVSPTIVSGFNMDFDGDAAQFHVPRDESAVKDAYERMLPSRNLLAVSNFKVHQMPAKEYAGGLYRASTEEPGSQRPRSFATVADAIRAYQRGEITSDQQVTVLS